MLGLLSCKNNKILVREKNGMFGWKMGAISKISQKGLSKGSEILHGLLSYQTLIIPMKKKNISETPLPLKKKEHVGGVFQKLVIGIQNFRYNF